MPFSNLPAQWRDRTIPCVVMCGGRSSRFHSQGGHKSMATVLGRPLLGHLLDYWRQFTSRFIFVVKHGRDTLVPFVEEIEGIESTIVEPPALRGIADGLRVARPYVGERFVVVLGDCFCRGEFSHPRPFSQGIGVWHTADTAAIQRNYAVYLAGDRVHRVEEKPRQVNTPWCGLGFYFLSARIFTAIDRTPPSPLRNEVEITDALQTLIDMGEELTPVTFRGTYVNVTVPADLERVRASLHHDDTAS